MRCKLTTDKNKVEIVDADKRVGANLTREYDRRGEKGRGKVRSKNMRYIPDGQ